MKATDIQIGDWLRTRYQNSNGKEVIIDFRVSQVRKFEVSGRVYIWSDKNGCVCDIDHLEPIPINHEILRRNGFGYVERDLITNIAHFYPGEPHFCKDMDLHIGTDNKGKFWLNTFSNTIYGLRFVHELQHAFSLCGIKKEIEL